MLFCFDPGSARPGPGPGAKVHVKLPALWGLHYVVYTAQVLLRT